MPLVDRYLPLPIRGDHSPAISGMIEKPNFFNFRRPYLDKYDRPCVTVNTGQTMNEKGEQVPIKRRALVIDLLNRGYQVPVYTLNATSMRKEDWIMLDRRVELSYRKRLKLWNNWMQRVPYGGFNGMAKMTLEYEAMSDPGEAVQDMDALSDAREDAPLFKLRSLPLAVTHSDFWYSERRLAVSRSSNTPLDSVSAEAGARRCGEMIEQTAIGTATGVTYGTQAAGFYGTTDLASTVYGLTNYPNRLTKTNMTAPTAGGWVPDTTHNEVLACLDTLYAQNVFGPFSIYYSTDWTQYMNRVYAVSGGNNPGETLRTMLLKTENIQSVERLDFLPSSTNPFTFLIVKEDSDVVQAVNGQDITTIMWEDKGGLRKNYKIIVIQVPLLRSDYSGRCGILQATTS